MFRCHFPSKSHSPTTFLGSMKCQTAFNQILAFRIYFVASLFLSLFDKVNIIWFKGAHTTSKAINYAFEIDTLDDWKTWTFPSKSRFNSDSNRLNLKVFTKITFWWTFAFDHKERSPIRRKNNKLFVERRPTLIMME